SAPQSPSTAAVAGPATHIASSTTLKPDSGPSIGRVSSRPNLVINSPPEKCTGSKFSPRTGRGALRTLGPYPHHEDSAATPTTRVSAPRVQRRAVADFAIL